MSTTVQGWTDFIAALAASVANPALGVVNPAVAAYLTLAASLGKLVTATDADLKALADEIKAMNAEGREPTDAEFDSLTARIQANSAAIAGN